MSDAKRVFVVLLLSVLAVAMPRGAGAQSDWPPLKGNYQVYSGELGDTAPPEPNDAKLAMSLTGPLAKDLFTRLGPSATDRRQCSSDIVTRSRGALSCTRVIATGEISCSLGFDIRRGKAIPGSIC